jgi:hypothetical protein
LSMAKRLCSQGCSSAQWLSVVDQLALAEGVSVQLVLSSHRVVDAFELPNSTLIKHSICQQNK